MDLLVFHLGGEFSYLFSITGALLKDEHQIDYRVGGSVTTLYTRKNLPLGVGDLNHFPCFRQYARHIGLPFSLP